MAVMQFRSRVFLLSNKHKGKDFLSAYKALYGNPTFTKQVLKQSNYPSLSNCEFSFDNSKKKSQ